MHYCSGMGDDIESFKKLLRKNDSAMFYSPYLNFDITREIQAHDNIKKFSDQLKMIEKNNSLIKIYKRSSSQQIKFRALSRLRAVSSEDEEAHKV